MRISDWSSDVCSSDLRQWRPDRKAIDDCRTLFAHLVLAIHARDIEHFGVLRDVRMFGAGIDAQVTHLLAPQRPARDHALDRLFEHALGEAAFEHRSEEHTSELQSLMRISYAVFCLKKKKKKIR